MKKVFFYSAIAIAVAGTQLTACKSKKAAETPTPTEMIVPAPDTQSTSPVVVAPDDKLTTGLKDATKDFPGVQASAANGEVTLTGNIKREKLTRLMQSVQSLHPKKVVNNLTIQP